MASSILLLCGNSHATRIKKTDEVYLEIIQNHRCLTSQLEDTTECSAVEKVLKLKHSFSLTGEKLADAMQVSRSAIYNWLDETHAMKPDNERRLEKLGSLTELWESKFDSPLGRIKGISRELKDQFYTALTQEDLGEASTLIETMKAAEAPRRKRKTVLDYIAKGQLAPLPKDISDAGIRSRTPSAAPLDDND
jgi:transcriptional regulator with XRE-family HTH domain